MVLTVICFVFVLDVLLSLLLVVTLSWELRWYLVMICDICLG